MGAAVFLASLASDFISGAVITVDGGTNGRGGRVDGESLPHERGGTRAVLPAEFGLQGL